MGHDRDAEMRSAQAHMSVLLLTATAEFDYVFFQSQTTTETFYTGESVRPDSPGLPLISSF